MGPPGRDQRRGSGISGVRRGRNAARISVEKSSGSSQAAKWPPRSTSLKYARPGETVSTQLRGAAQSSPGNVVKATGTETAGGASLKGTAAAATAKPRAPGHQSRI